MKEIQIKTKVVKRLQKELEYYRKELAAQEADVRDLEISGAVDWHVLNKKKEATDETRIVIPSVQKRLDVALKELEELLGNEEDEEARQVLQAVKGC